MKAKRKGSGRRPSSPVEIPPPGPKRNRLCRQISAAMSADMGVVNGAPVGFVQHGLQVAEEILRGRRKVRLSPKTGEAVLWVIEALAGESEESIGSWLPTEGTYTTRQEAERFVKDWREDNIGRRYRIAKYLREKEEWEDW